MMRVIAGKARRIQLKTIPGMDTRPTTDRIKETLFNILQPELYRTHFLDLFSGSGAIGIEALSRGCEMAVFVENNRQAVSCIRDNLKCTKLSEHAVVIEKDVYTALQILESEGKCFDIVFMDPPYNCFHEKKVLERLSSSSLIHKDTLIVVEASLETDFSYIESYGYNIVREKAYKTNKHIFLRIK
ncbi:16S rRNA (guanine(966)-N(2))-methyltransferase RsmD [Frisingicoccus sp.]|uniref:16S rRNA (guanine(966)-N(2))-methyltransferase RsmD n=1 Tax=Frisingicoccus sp. TaxID=1918627 RepID=UPI002EB1997E|nr:16S rRNA (guanine(966)-N(2))-methyltransferase RsmD [Frisingicoccus sp.]